MTGRDDVVIAGAGPAGAFAALLLARSGARVTLIERSRFPRPKLCGDTLNPGAVAALARALDLGPLAARARPIDGMLLTGPGPVLGRGEYGAGIRGLGVTRVVFDGWLVGQTGSKQPQLWRWNGTNWTNLLLPSGWVSTAKSLWANTPNDVYASVGDQLWHFNGTDWTTVNGGSPVAATHVAASVTDVLAIKRASSAVDNGYYHSTGTTWSFVKCCDDITAITAVGGSA